MEIENLTSDQLTHDVFKEQIVGLIKRYQVIIEDPTTDKETLKWLNEELEQLSVWLTSLDEIKLNINFENLQTVLDDSTNKYNEFVQLSDTKLLELTQTFNDKATQIDTTFETKENEITQTFNNKATEIDTTFNTKLEDINTKLTNGTFDGKTAYQLAVDTGYTGTLEQWLESLKSTLDYNDLQNKPIIPLNANDLDDYEEGTWTPIIMGSNISGNYNLSFQGNKYIKVGNLVTLSVIIISIEVLEVGSGVLIIGGIPFYISDSVNPQGNVQANEQLDFPAGSFPSWHLYNSQSQIRCTTSEAGYYSTVLVPNSDLINCFIRLNATIII